MADRMPQYFAVVIVQVIRKELPSLAFAVLGVLVYRIPWALSPREVTFLYHFLPALVFVVLIIDYFLESIWERFCRGKYLVLLYLLVPAGTFV
jgi:dolichyl-phosphate-mannose--protein O-mannosyl transferase